MGQARTPKYQATGVIIVVIQVAAVLYMVLGAVASIMPLMDPRAFGVGPLVPVVGIVATIMGTIAMCTVAEALAMIRDTAINSFRTAEAAEGTRTALPA